MSSSLYPHPWVMIVGRTNVGKSTVYNKLLSAPEALVSREPNTTRDVARQLSTWQGKTFTLIDSGGLEWPPDHKPRNSDDPYTPMIHEQLKRALKGVDALLFIVDAKAGLMPQDRAWARWLKRQQARRVILIANKVDGPRDRANVHEFIRLGFGEPLLCSALTGGGTGDLLDTILPSSNLQPPPSSFQPPTSNLRLLLLGKTNVGKSTLANALVGYPAMITSALPHTTRGPQELLVDSGGATVSIIDTAGVRKRATKNSFLESLGSQRTKERLKVVDCAMLVVDPFDVSVSSHDRTLAQWIADERRAAMIVVNKIDLLTPAPTDKQHKKLEAAVRSHFPHLSYAPVLFISAQRARGLEQLKTMVHAVIEHFRTELSAQQLEEFAASTSLFDSPKARSRLNVRLTQSSATPPEFILTMKRKARVPIAILNRLEKKLREHFDFVGTPIVIHVERYAPGHVLRTSRGALSDA